MINVSQQTDNSLAAAEGLRPVNLRTDLAPLADLIELVFADSMDSSGRAALREMRYLSRMGVGLNVISHVNELANGVGMGYVWVANGQIVGNVSIYAGSWPQDLGSAWIIANVGVHPDYQKRGIARQLMQTSLEAIRQRGGTLAVLQVDEDNHPARHLYRTLGFREERTWTTWRRSSSIRTPTAHYSENVYIRRRRLGEWKTEMALANRLRPQHQGGMGWMRPLHPSLFRRSFWQTMGDWLSLRTIERLVIRAAEGDRLLASLWAESSFASRTRLTLMVDPLFQGIYDDLLLNNVVRRLGRTPLTIEHPTDEHITNDVLRRYHFTPQRDVIHMRWNAT